MTTSEIYKKAKIYKLSRDELDFIIAFSTKLGFDPNRALVNKALFNRLVETYKKESFKPNEKMIESIKNKLSFTSPLDTLFRSSRDFPVGVRAKFYFDKYAYAPIALEKNQPDYQLWQVISHRNMDRVKKSVEGFVVIDDKYGRSYKYPTKILDELRHKDITLVRTLHSDDIELLQNRKYPRVAMDNEVFIKKEDRKGLFKGIICNLSIGGAKLFIESSEQLFDKNDRISLRFDLDARQIEAEAKVVYAGNMNYYGVMFEDLDFQSLRTIENYIERNLDDLI